MPKETKGILSKNDLKKSLKGQGEIAKKLKKSRKFKKEFELKIGKNLTSILLYDRSNKNC